MQLHRSDAVKSILNSELLDMRWVPPLHFRYPPPVHFLPYLHALHACHHTACVPTNRGARVTLTRGRLVKAATAEAETEDAIAKLAEEKKRCMSLHFIIAGWVWAAVLWAMALEAIKAASFALCDA